MPGENRKWSVVLENDNHTPGHSSKREIDCSDVVQKVNEARGANDF